MMTLRFSDIIGVKDQAIMVVGAGATGSWFTAMAVKQGYSVIAVDYDHVEPHNIGTSIYTPQHIGASKVEALAEILGDGVTPIQDKFDAKHVESHNPDLLVAAVDNMATRRQIYEAARSMAKPLIDMRVHYPYAVIYAVEPSPSAMSRDGETLYDDEQAWEGDCTRQNTPFLSAIAASIALKYASFKIRGFTMTAFNAEKMMLVEVNEV